ncbi:MAG TPA: DUF2807 domain-containing protein [Candidatus Binatia bacterium]|nr:DUF2807 domain-containing protein [Candidatus Binatia bacterium]
MNRLIAPFLIAAALAGPAGAETRSLSGFQAVDAEDRLTVTIGIGDAYAVDVTGSDAGRISTHVDGRTLYIEDERRPLLGRSPRLDAHVRVTMPAIESVSAARGAQLAANLAGGACDEFSASAAMGGSANIENALCNGVSSTAAMGGEVRIAGTCRRHDVSASMGGYIRARDMQCATVDASASMGGDINAYASQSYDASASMGGSINVVGGASASDTSSIMGGSVRSRR